MKFSVRVFGALAILFSDVIAAEPEVQSGILTQIAEVGEFAREDAARGREVRVNGMITWRSRRGQSRATHSSNSAPCCPTEEKIPNVSLLGSS